MGRRGPPPKPSALVEYEGNPGKKPDNVGEPKPPLMTHADPPMELPPMGMQIWDTLVPMLARIKLVTEADLMAYWRYCDLFARYLQLREYVIDQEKLNRGKPYVGPEDQRMIRIAEKLAKLEGEFGMTPAARARIQIETDPSSDINETGNFLFGDAA